MSNKYRKAYTDNPVELKPCPFCGGDAGCYLQQYETPFSEPYCYMQVCCVRCGVFFETRHLPVCNVPVIPDEEIRVCVDKWNGRYRIDHR